ncbi:matrix metalloproteinase-21-like [Spea bombifrons]|uniref:matrix metalloproteinase-21-like n=1 Tax=Spea bombifrons TaxID=233779 RepID=UPI00234BE7CC|nr:matrix metalloproteinase-21-like [Spea bombifrons]
MSWFSLYIMMLHLSATETLSHPRELPPRAKNQGSHMISSESAQKYLWKYGWFEPVHWDSSRRRPGESVENVAPPDATSLQSGDDSPSSVLDDTNGGLKPTLSPRFVGALMKFQEANGLKVTGVLDKDTREAMSVPRCGVPDRKFTEEEWPDDGNTGNGATTMQKKQVTVTTTPSRVSEWVRNSQESDKDKTRPHTQEGDHLYLNLASPGRKKRSHLLKVGYRKVAFSKPTVKWRLLGEGYSVWLSIDQQRYVLKLAFRIWSEVVPLNFEEDLVSPAHLIDIKLGFGTRRHLGCSQLFAEMGREFAHAWQLGDIHFNDDEHFVPPDSEHGISLLKVAVHEIGHVLGLSHMNERTSVMQPNYTPINTMMALEWTDRRAVQGIYGRCSGRFNTVFDWVQEVQGTRVFVTYFFRRSWYWRYENHNNRPQQRYPRMVTAGWRGLPKADIDAFLSIYTGDLKLTLFFKGMQYWRYDNENDRAYTTAPDGHVYPRLISDGFPGISGPIDTAFYDQRDQNVYFFRGRNVTAFSVKDNQVISGYPKAISDVYPAGTPGDHPIGDLDAVYFSFTHNNIFFFKGLHVWRLANYQGLPVDPRLPSNALLPRRPINEQWFDICDVHPSMLFMPGGV